MANSFKESAKQAVKKGALKEKLMELDFLYCDTDSIMIIDRSKINKRKETNV